jgi:hypothetical protein
MALRWLQGCWCCLPWTSLIAFHCVVYALQSLLHCVRAVLHSAVTVLWLQGNNMPVFFIRDGISFPDMVHALKPNPRSHIQGERVPPLCWWPQTCAHAVVTSNKVHRFFLYRCIALRHLTKIMESARGTYSCFSRTYVWTETRARRSATNPMLLGLWRMEMGDRL